MHDSIFEDAFKHACRATVEAYDALKRDHGQTPNVTEAMAALASFMREYEIMPGDRFYAKYHRESVTPS